MDDIVSFVGIKGQTLDLTNQLLDAISINA